jgi:hypothetical protein
MSLLRYSQNEFYQDVKNLERLPYNHTLSENLQSDAAGGMFGDQDWVNMDSDLREVPEQRRAYFCLCLFAITCTDQNMYAHFREHHQAYRSVSPHPKFGWPGFGANVCEPRLLLEKPAMAGVNFNQITDNELEEYMQAQLRVAPRFLQGVDPREFFRRMLEDRDFDADVDVFRRLKAVMEGLVA